MITFLRVLVAIAGSLVLTVAATMYGGLYFISFLINDSSVNWAPDRLNLKLGSFATVLILALILVIGVLVSVWQDHKGWTIALVIISVFTLSNDVAIGMDHLVHVMTGGLGWTKAEVGFYVAFLVFVTAVIAFGGFTALFSDDTNTGKKAKSKRPKELVHVLRLDLGAVATRTSGGFPVFLSGKWIAWRLVEGLAFGSLASVALLWHTSLTNPQTTMKIIWTCVVLSAFAGVILGLGFAFAHFQAYGILPRLATELTFTILIASYNTNWFWLFLGLTAIEAAAATCWIIRSKRLVR